MPDPRQDIMATPRRMPAAAWVRLLGTFIKRFGAFVLVILGCT
jgi:hypothetical protein